MARKPAIPHTYVIVFAFIIAGETMTLYGWMGGALILAGMIVAEIKWKLIFKNITNH